MKQAKKRAKKLPRRKAKKPVRPSGNRLGTQVDYLEAYVDRRIADITGQMRNSFIAHAKEIDRSVENQIATGLQRWTAYDAYLGREIRELADTFSAAFVTGSHRKSIERHGKELPSGECYKDRECFMAGAIAAIAEVCERLPSPSQESVRLMLDAVQSLVETRSIVMGIAARRRDENV